MLRRPLPKMGGVHREWSARWHEERSGDRRYIRAQSAAAYETIAGLQQAVASNGRPHIVSSTIAAPEIAPSYAGHTNVRRRIRMGATMRRRNAMTTPVERTRALLWAGSLLIEIAQDATLPASIRRRAVAVARHFPAVEDLASMSTFRHSSGLALGLAPPSEVPTSGREFRLHDFTRLEWPAN